jgi:hypothetical protein
LSPESLAELVGRLGANASAGTVAEAAQADLVILAVGWDQVPKAVQDLPDRKRRVVIDATNQWQGPGAEVDLGDQTGSERNAALMPGARAPILAVRDACRAGGADAGRASWRCTADPRPPPG